MRVNVVSFTGTHPLNLARELEKAGELGTFYTGLPRFRVTGIPQERVAAHPIVLLPHYLLRRAGLASLEVNISWRTTEAFDRWLARSVTACDVFHVLSSYGLRAIRRARSEFGSYIVCDRGSSHIRVQNELLREEFARWGQPFRTTDLRFITKEEAEYAEADAIVVPSTFARQTFLDQGIHPSKVALVPYGVRLEEYFSTGKRDDVFRVLCVAVLSIRKGIGYLLEATSGPALPNSEVVLRGIALPETKAILARYEGAFRYSPPVPRRIGAHAIENERAELRDLYSQASVLVLPSVEDGFGMVISQAMACGVPVIATTNTGAADVITDGKDGFIVPARSPGAIRERLQFLYEHPEERAAMGRAALEKVRSLGGWSQYAALMTQLYRDRLAHRRAS